MNKFVRVWFFEKLQNVKKIIHILKKKENFMDFI